MIPNDHGTMMFKFSEKRWNQKIINGEISFSCAGAFIAQAKRTGNIIQGDDLEGVFARQHKDNPNISKMRKNLGKDLEEILDGDYVYLRRKSAKFKPIFCNYAYTAMDTIKDAAPKKSGKQTVKLTFDRRLFDGFADSSVENVVSDSHQFTILFLQVRPFMERLNFSLKQQRLFAQVRPVTYQKIHSGEFFIEPTDEYQELFFKSDEYSYQHEERICLTHKKFTSISERYTLNIGALNQDEYIFENKKIYLTFIADFIKA